MNENVLSVLNNHIEASGKAPNRKTGSGFYTSYFENWHGEQLVFQFDLKTGKAKLWHGDHSWEHPVAVKGGLAPTLIIDAEEQAWLLLVWRLADRIRNERGLYSGA